MMILMISGMFDLSVGSVVAFSGGLAGYLMYYHEVHISCWRSLQGWPDRSDRLGEWLADCNDGYQPDDTNTGHDGHCTEDLH